VDTLDSGVHSEAGGFHLIDPVMRGERRPPPNSPSRRAGQRETAMQLTDAVEVHCDPVSAADLAGACVIRLRRVEDCRHLGEVVLETPGDDQFDNVRGFVRCIPERMRNAAWLGNEIARPRLQDAIPDHEPHLALDDVAELVLSAVRVDGRAETARGDGMFEKGGMAPGAAAGGEHADAEATKPDIGGGGSQDGRIVDRHGSLHLVNHYVAPNTGGLDVLSIRFYIMLHEKTLQTEEACG
jgi:hypothetical protein